MSRYGFMLGLAAMAAVTPGCGDGADGPQGVGSSLVAPTTAPAPGAALEETAQWKHLQATWAEASEIGAGKRGDYLFTEKEKKRLLEHLQLVTRDITQLQHADLLTEAEAQLLRKDLPDVVSGVECVRTKEMREKMRGISCYAIVPIPPASMSVPRLKDRLPLLEKLAGGEALHPVVVRKMLAKVQADLEVLANGANIAELPADQQEQAREVYRSATRQVQSIQKQLENQTPSTAPAKETL